MDEEVIKERIDNLVKKAAEAATADEALKYSQAACNAANALRAVTGPTSERLSR